MAQLFSYGTLRLPSVQQTVFGRLVDGVPDAIIGYDLGEVVITDPDVIAASGSSVHPMLIPSEEVTAEVEGTVFDLNDGGIASADRYEVDT